jgi:hypothetical protein
MGEPSVRLVAVAPSIIDLRPPPGLDSSSPGADRVSSGLDLAFSAFAGWVQ